MNKVLIMSILTCLSIFFLSYFKNTPPVIQSDIQYQTYIDSLLTISFSVSDPDGDDIRIKVEGLPEWLSLEEGESIIKGRPGKAEEGQYKIWLIANDGKEESKKEIDVKVKLTLQETLDKHLKELCELHTPGLVGVSAAIVSPDGRLVKSCVGKRNRWSDAPASIDLQYRVASVTKTFTATLSMKLVEEGMLSLDDPISKYIDVSSFAYGKEMTILHLLNHTSGMIDHLNRSDFYKGNWQYRKWTERDILNYAKPRKSLFKPGTKYSYSNTAYFLMGSILEKVTGKKLGEAYKEWIFNPLGLENTFYDDFSTRNNKIEGLAQNSRSYEYHLSAVGAAGAIVSTPEDLAKFGKKLYGGNFLSETSMKAMLTDYGSPVGGDEIGLGTRMWEDFDIYHYGHTGSLMDYRSVLMYIPEKKICIALSTNQVHKKWFDLVNNLLKEIYHYY